MSDSSGLESEGAPERIRATSFGSLPVTYAFEPYRLDAGRMLLLANDEAVAIAPRALEILLVLVRANGRVVTKEEFFTTLWPDEPVGEGVLTQYIFLLRRLLGEGRAEHKYIATVQGRGYRFVAPVSVRESLGESVSQEEAAALGAVLAGERFTSFRLYCRGQHAMESRSEPGLLRALNFFGEALEADPSYAPAHLGVAEAHCLLGEYLFRAPADAFGAAKVAALRALGVNRTSADAHAVLGEILLFEREWSAARRELDAAAQLGPHAILVRHWRAWYFVWRGEPERALTELGWALRAAPGSTLLLATLGNVLIHCGRAEEATEHLRALSRGAPGSSIAQYYLALASIACGDHHTAITLLKASGGDHPQQRLALLGHAYGAAGKERLALETLARLEDLASSRYVARYSRAIVYGGLGMHARALDALESAFAESDAWLPFLPSDPLFKNLQSEARFRALVDRIATEKTVY